MFEKLETTDSRIKAAEQAPGQRQCECGNGNGGAANEYVAVTRQGGYQTWRKALGMEPAALSTPM